MTRLPVSLERDSLRLAVNGRIPRTNREQFDPHREEKKQKDREQRGKRESTWVFIEKEKGSGTGDRLKKEEEVNER